MEALHVNLCPKFTLYSALCLLSVIEIIVFVAELSIGGLSNNSFLGASPSTLDKMGEKVSLHFSGIFWKSSFDQIVDVFVDDFDGRILTR